LFGLLACIGSQPHDFQVHVTFMEMGSFLGDNLIFILGWEKKLSSQMGEEAFQEKIMAHIPWIV
jgi:hypothetical protein